MNDFKLTKVTIDHFRGYRDSREFDLQNNDISILAGANGFGKTSFFDAIEWAFTGKLFRYETANEERSNTKFINFQPNEENATVILEFGNGINQYILTRKATESKNRATDYGESRTKITLKTPDKGVLKNTYAVEELNNLLVRDEWKSKIKFEDVFSQYHLLTQDKLKHFIQGLKGPERFNQLSVLFGTEQFTKYRENFKAVQVYYSEKLDSTNSNLNKIIIEIGELENHIKQKVAVGISNYDDKLTSVVVAYNLVLNGTLKDADHNTVSDKCTNYKEQTQKELNSLKVEIPIRISNKESLQSLYGEVPTYTENKKKAEKFAIIHDYGKQIEELSTIQSNLSFFQNYTTIRQKQLDEIQAKSKILEHAKVYKSEIQELEDLMNGIINFIKASNINDHGVLSSFPQYFKEVITKLSQNSNHVQYELRNEISYISIGDYALSINTKDHFKPLITLCLSLIADLLNQVEEYINQVNEFARFKIASQSEKNSIDQDIANLSVLQSNIKNILDEALNHITRMEDREVKCPVCTSHFSKEDLIGKIKMQLVQKNPVIEEKLERQQFLVNKVYGIDVQLKEVTENIQTIIEKFETTIFAILGDISGLGNLLESETLSAELVLTRLSNDLKKIDEQYQTMIFNINKIGLDKDIKMLNKQLAERIAAYYEKISSLDYIFQNGELDVVVSELNQYISQRDLFEEKLKIKGVTTGPNLIDETLQLINQESLKLTKLEERIKILESLNTELDEINLAAIEDTNQKRLSELLLKQGILIDTVKSYEKIINNLKLLQSAVTNSIGNINKTLFDENKQFVNAIFKRLNPHPHFRSVDFDVDENNRGSNTLSLNCKNQDSHSINPAYIFSSAQINILALSIFLSIALRQRCTRLELILLDDPIQNMDDMNVVAFIDIIRSLYSEINIGKQVVLSTHDDQLYRLMMKKFRFFKTKAFEFIRYSELGPGFKMRDISTL